MKFLRKIKYYGGEKMRIMKYVGLLAIIPLFTITIMFGFSDNVYAVNTGTVDDGAGDKHFGSGTKGSMPEAYLEPKAESIEAKVALEGPYFEIVDVQPASANSPNTFKVLLKVYAGDQNLGSGEILVKSDIDTAMSTIGGIWAGDYDLTSIMIKANDPTSIELQLLSFELND